MDIRIFVLLVFVGVLGSLTETQAGFIRYPRNGEAHRDTPPIMEYVASRSKREVGDSNGETANSSETTTKSTTTPATTTTSSSTTDPTTTDPTTTDSTSTTVATTTDPTTTDPTTTDPTSPSTTPSTEPTTPTTEPTTEPTTPTTTIATTPSTTPTTANTTPGSTTTTPESTKPTEEPTDDILSRSNFDEPESEDSPNKPGPSSTDDAAPTPGPYYGPGAFGPYFGPGFGSGFDPYFGYPGPNFIPGSGQTYGWPSANSGSSFASAGASAGATAGSFAGGYSGMGYPTPGFPTAGSTNIGSRGGFRDNSPDQTGYNPSGIDPLYNAGPGFFFPGQFPGYNDPFDMFKQIQAQIEAQHQASANSMAFQHSLMANQRGAWNTPNYPYPYASGNVNNNGRYPTFGSSFNPGVGNSNMEFHNRLANEAANYGGTPQVASASIGLGPNGGFQTGQISPALPGIESRFAEDLPSPSGNSFGVFASSSSSSMTGPDGKQINHKTSTTGVNDNGKISYRTVHD